MKGEMRRKRVRRGYEGWKEQEAGRGLKGGYEVEGRGLEGGYEGWKDKGQKGI